MTFDILSFVIGTILGIVGLVVAYIQWKQTKDVERLRREQLLATINRAKYLIIPNDVIEKIISNDSPESRETLRQWLWTLHKGASDNYVNAVYYYLSFEDKFTYDDLEFIRKAGTITTKWEEHTWRSLIALRSENRKAGIKIPDFELDRPGSTVKLRKDDDGNQPQAQKELYITPEEKGFLDLLERGADLYIPIGVSLLIFVHFILGVKIVSGIPTIWELWERMKRGY